MRASPPPTLSIADERACLNILRVGSKSFYAAARLLPPRVRRPAIIVYAFCRISDDAVDHTCDAARGLGQMRRRLAQIYDGAPSDHSVDRALAYVIAVHALPRALFEGLLEGYLWDVENRRYDDLADLQAYCARVAGTVGAVMSLLMGQRDPLILARACDLGVAMQLTNICRDVGEDAGAGRLYLPQNWLRDGGVEPAQWLEAPTFSPAIADAVRRLLAIADDLYARANIGIAHLPFDCRASIRAAQLIYADIGRVVRANGHDSLGRRAVVGRFRKLALLTQACGALLWGARVSNEPPLCAAQFVIDAIACESP